MSRYLQIFFTFLCLMLASATLHACPGCSSDVASNSALSSGFTYATFVLIAIPVVVAVAVFKGIRRIIRSVLPAEKERNVTSFYDPDQG